MLRRFNGGVEFTDEKDGFFGFLKETFAQLAKEEEFAVRRDGGVAMDYPSFGHSGDNYESVVRPFYSVWASFSTRKTFSWRDRWRTSDAPDRRTRRLAEKENQRLREDGAREFNDAVRTLVAFVRKRDPRVQNAVGVTKTTEEREKVLREVAKERAAKMRRENEEKLGDVNAVPEWARAPVSREDEELEGSVGGDEESEEEQYECVACRKTFKSENQFEAHERSKKHQKAVEALRKKLKKEGVELDLDEDGEDDTGPSGVATPAADEDGFEEDKSNGRPGDEAMHAEETMSGDADTTSLHDDIDDHNLAHAVQESMQNLTVSPNTNGHTTKPVRSTGSDEDIDDNALSDSSNSDSSLPSNTTPTSEPQQPHQKLGKAAQKRAKKAAQATAAADQADEFSHKCASCKAAFPSRTRLFQHIKDHGHAAPVPVGKKKKGKR